MDKSGKSKLANEIEDRLDDFFTDDETQKQPQAAQYSLENLKSAVLSIDWEITDECLADLINESDALLPHFEKDPITHALLRMLRALGRYIQKRKAQSHQDAIKRIMSVFASLEKLINDTQLNTEQRKEIVAKEILAFKNLKEKVEAGRPIKTPSGRTVEYNGDPTDLAALLNNDKFKQAMNAVVEKKINNEVKDLKAKLATLEKELDTLRKR